MTAHSFNRNSASSTRSVSTRRNMRRARGFTLIEVLVALAIFTVLMVIIFVPLTQATRFMAIGRTRAALQQSANGTMLQLQRDLSRAIYVYPNDNLPGVTDQTPYINNNNLPYRDSAGGGIGNTSRIDLLLPELDTNGGVKYPITPAKYIVTYYARRLRTTDDSGNSIAYDPYRNPIVLFRAQYPYMNASGDRAGRIDTVDTSNTRYGGAGLEWLTTNANNEFNQLEDLCVDTTPTADGFVSGGHNLVTPSNVQLVAPNATWPTPSPLPATYSLKPNTTFNLADSNSDGKIDRVSVNLTLMNFNRQVRSDGGNDTSKAIGENSNFQRFTLSQTFNLPNIR